MFTPLNTKMLTCVGTKKVVFCEVYRELNTFMNVSMMCSYISIICHLYLISNFFLFYILSSESS